MNAYPHLPINVQPFEGPRPVPTLVSMTSLIRHSQFG